MGCLNASGYGNITVTSGGIRKSKLAHRVSYEAHFGSIPEGLVVMHSCDNPACIEPEHLSVGTQLDNVTDMIQKNRKVILRGQAHGRTRLTDDQVKEIYLSDLSDSALAKQFEINRSVPWKIRRGHLWVHITQDLVTPE
jgi:hypothetical protein